MSAMRALVIDDNALNVEVLTTLLAEFDIETVAVAIPRDLPAIIPQVLPLEVIFLDLEFPNHDGFDLHRALRALPALRTVPIVAYSVHNSEIDRVRAAGFDGFLGKPLDGRRFPSMLQHILHGGAVWEA